MNVFAKTIGGSKFLILRRKSLLLRFHAKFTQIAMIDAPIDKCIPICVFLGHADKFIGRRSEHIVKYAIVGR